MGVAFAWPDIKGNGDAIPCERSMRAISFSLFWIH